MILLLIVVVTGWFATVYLGNKARQEIIGESQASVLTLSIYVSSTLNNIEGAVKSLAGSPWIAPALMSKRNQDIEHANSVLDRYNSALNASVSYLMAADGMTVASSNRHDQDSFVGKSLSFRPYFQEAAKGQPGRYFALGTIAKKRGFYASYPVQNRLGKVVGVVTMKKDLDEMETFFSKYPFCFLINRDGIIFLSSSPAMVLKSLWPLDKSVQENLIASQQFGKKLFEPGFLKQEIADGTEVTLEGKDYFISRKVIDSDGWSIMLLTPTDRIRNYKLIGILATISLCFLIMVFSGIVYVTYRSKEAFRQSEELYKALAEKSIAGVYVVQDGKFRFINSNAASYAGYTREELLDREAGLLVSPEDREKVRQNARAMLLGEMSSPYEFRIITKQGETRWIMETVTSILHKGRPAILGNSMNITERMRTEEKIQYLATHDVLTGLPNRSMFSQLLNHAIQAAQRYQRQFAVLFIDLDRFKIINDTLGHEAGDQLLQEIATRLKQPLRAVDVVGRLGGDEFIILIEEVNDSSQVATVAHKILASIIKPVTLMGQECRITASIGICMYPKDAEDEQSLMKNADIAMYFAKEEGKNNYQFYSKDIQSKSLEHLSIETNLRFALERNELSLHYQAKVDFKTNAITGVEALLRWQNPYLGSVTPTQFIPVAEETGLIISIGKWVMKTACAQNVAWQQQGLPVVCMAVNLSLRQLTDDNLIADIGTALNDSGMAPNLLELEITESMVMYDPARMISILAKIKGMGVRLAIDDFGTGYASLAHIKHFPVDTIKVDRSFIRNIPQDVEDKAITEAIIAMGKALSLTVVAEGVETEEQINFLKEHSCDEMQGFYFSKPVVPEQFADLLRKHVSPPQK